MKKRLIRLISLCFLILLPNFVNAGEREDAMILVDNSLVIVRHACVYTTTFKLRGETDEQKHTVIDYFGGMGTGFFIDKPTQKSNQYNIFTAGHVVDCGLRWYMEVVAEKLPHAVTNMELKSSELLTLIKYKGVWYPAFVEDLKFNGAYPDYAMMLTAVLPENAKPHLMPFGLRRGEYGVGSPVVFRGYMGIGEGVEELGAEEEMMIMLDEALIQHIGKNFFRISLEVFPGMSGSPILFWKNGKYFAVGIVSAGFQFRSAIITDLDFLNK